MPSHKWLSLAFLSLTAFGFPFESHADPDLLSVVKKLEARVTALEEENRRIKVDTARAKVTRQQSSLTPSPGTYAMVTKAPAVSRAPVPSAPHDLWSGVYWGASFGGAMSQSQISSRETYTNFVSISAPFRTEGNSIAARSSGSANPGASLDLFAGYNTMIGPNFLAGVQLEGSLAELDFNSEGTRKYTYFNDNGPTGETATGDFRPHVHARWVVSALARAGVLIEPSTLVYGIGGFTAARFDYQNLTNNSFFEPGETFWAPGWSAGGGIERKLDANWSIRAEYRYTQFRAVDVGNNFAWTFSAPTYQETQTNTIQSRFENQMHVVRIALSYLSGISQR